MELVPENFAKLYERIILSSDCNQIISNSKEIIQNTKKLFDRQAINSETPAFADVFRGFYEETKSYYNKVSHACETGDYQTAILAASAIENMVNECLDATGTDRSDLPRLLTSIDPSNLTSFIDTLKTHEECFVDILKSNKHQILQYQSFGDFKASLGLARDSV
jgi:hypothetical protein